MELNEIFESYASKMTQLSLYQRAIKDLAKKELERIHGYQKSLEENPDLKVHSFSHHKMTFRKAIDGELLVYGRKKRSIEDRKTSVFLHKNKQYQWLLSEAYEEFEDCIERLYAYAGYTNHDFWPLKDYGNISLNEISSKNFEWFEQQSINKKDAPAGIINIFREAYSDLKAVEAENKLGINLRLAITTVEFLRHVIVHRGGVVLDKSKFKERVLKKSGLWNNGKIAEEHSGFIDNFFGNGEYENTIILLEVPTNPEIPLDTYINVFDELCGYLMAYVHLICVSMDEPHNKSRDAAKPIIGSE